jgi:excinuclease UvrABC nuclease subunit
MSARQLRLFAAPKPLADRLGVEFFRAIPQEPGVYFMFDAAGRLIYVGQSANLRDRLNSYRHVHPDRDSRKTVRLVHSVARIQWEVCLTPQAAVLRENECLRVLRPRFNRANIYPKAAFFIGMREQEGNVLLALTRDTEFAGSLFGAFKASTSWAFASLARLMFIASNAPGSLGQMPRKLLSQSVAREQVLAVEAPVAERLHDFLRGGSDALVQWLVEVCVAVKMNTPFEQNLMLSDLVVLEEFFHRGPRRVLALRQRHGIERPWLEPEELTDLSAMAGFAAAHG